MKVLCGVLMALALLAAPGCNSKSGGPGATGSVPDTLAIVQPQDSFRLEPPLVATRLKHGETREVSIGVRRGTNMAQDITVKFTDVPEGLQIDPIRSTLKNSTEALKVMLTASNHAAVGDFTVRVIGHSHGGGADAVSDLKISIRPS